MAEHSGYASIPGQVSCVVIFFFFPVVCNFNILKTLTLLVYAGLFCCFHSPPNSDMDYKILNVPTRFLFFGLSFGAPLTPNQQLPEAVWTRGSDKYPTARETHPPLTAD